jgi:Secretion system C-terminal sorting domain
MDKFNKLLVGIFILVLASGLFAQDITKKVIEVPKVDTSVINVDGVMDETAWQTAAEANLITSTGFNIWTNKYYREELTEPDYDELYGKMLWTKDTLYVFIHIDEFVNDSTNLFWDGKWTGDQLFISLSNRMGVNMMGWYDGNVYAAPNGPYHFLVLGEDFTLNNGEYSGIPDEYKGCPDDTSKIFNASDIARWGITIDTLTGVWNIEAAIYNPNVTSQSSIGFNIGGSTGSTKSHADFGDAYAYYTWQPNVENEPYSNPTGENDPGFYNLANSDYWAVLNFASGPVGVEDNFNPASLPERFSLHQNYPNPFNPSTTIRFDVSDNSPVSISIYNVVGQLVTKLVDGRTFAPGTYSVTWDATKLSSGVYFYELKTKSVHQTMKMLLVK